MKIAKAFPMVARLALKEFTGVNGKESTTISIVWSVIDGAVGNHFFLIDCKMHF